jgi:PAS domain S-box-containing protein
MKDKAKTKQVLIQELVSLRERNAELEQLESERKRVDDLLRLRSEILANMVEGVHLARVDDGVIIHTNSRFESMFGYDSGELVGKHVSIVNAPGVKSPEAVANEIIRSLEQTGVWNGEVHNIRKDGTTFWCYANVSKFKHPQNGEVWISVHQNITEHKQEEEKLKKSEAAYRTLFENNLMAISQALPDGRLICVNMAYAKMYGYDGPDEMIAEVTDIGRQLYANPEDRNEVLRILAEKGVMEPREIPVVRRDGTRFYVLAAAKEIRDTSGKLVCFQATHVDITERKKAEEMLRSERDNLDAIMRSSPVGLLVIDEQEFVVNANPAAERLFCRKLSDLKHRRCGDFIGCINRHEESAGCGLTQHCPACDLYRSVKNVLAGGHGVTNRDMEAVVEIGEKTAGIWLLFSVDALLLNDRRHVIVALHDITDHKRLEAGLRESEERFRQVSLSITNIAYSCRRRPDGDYGIDWITGAVEPITGYSVNEIRALGCWGQIILKEDRHLFEENVTALAPETFGKCELRLRRKDGLVRWVLSFSRCITSPKDPATLLLHGALVDITDFKRAEEEKHRMEERSRKVVEDIFRFIPEGVLVFSRKMELLRQNQAFRDLVSGNARRLGFDEDELENLIIDKIKAAMGKENIKEIRISRQHETGE